MFKIFLMENSRNVRKERVIWQLAAICLSQEACLHIITSASSQIQPSAKGYYQKKSHYENVAAYV